MHYVTLKYMHPIMFVCAVINVCVVLCCHIQRCRKGDNTVERKLSSLYGKIVHIVYAAYVSCVTK